MNWFGGSIPEAIGLAKSSDAIFVVYIHDASEASKTTDEALAETATVLSSKKFVAIKLENGTENSNQFSQIYPVVVLPSLYFISGSTGMPLEILGGAVTKEKLKEKLDLFAKDAKAASEKPQEEPSKSAPEEMMVDEPTVPASAPEASAISSETSTPPQSTSSTSTAPPAPENITDGAEVEMVEPMSEDGDSGEKDSSPPTENKVERAKILLAEKQAQKSEEQAEILLPEDEDNKKKEVDRRKSGQDIAKRKRQMHEEELQTAARERKKEKDDDRAARERVKAQIAADRLERETRASLLQGGEAPAPVLEPSVNAPPVAAASNRNATVTRLKFRMPDGSSSIAQFPVEATLAEVRQHVQQQLVSSSSFMLTSTMHHRPFSTQDNEKSLSDLGLVPSAIIVVLLNSLAREGGSIVSSNGGIMQFLWLLLSPITFLFGFIRQLFSGGSSAPRRPPSNDSAPTGSSQATPQQRPSTSYGRHRENRLNREGNIHRLHNSNDDEDNNTWNGNSTQQM